MVVEKIINNIIGDKKSKNNKKVIDTLEKAWKQLPPGISKEEKEYIKKLRGKK